MKKWSKAKKILIALVVLYVAWVAVYNLGASDTAANQQPANSPKIKSAAQMQQDITVDSLYIAINKVRAQYNLPLYSHNLTLDKSSSLKCNDMVKYNYYAHDNPKTGVEFGSFLKQVNQYHNGASENLDVGFFDTADDVVNSWMGSESHKASIIDPAYTEIGFATCIIPQYSNQLAVVQHKIKPAPAPQKTSTTVENHYYSSPSVPTYTRPTTTNCTLHEYKYFDDTVSCNSY